MARTWWKHMQALPSTNMQLLHLPEHLCLFQVDIPEGSMMVPEDAVETVVVLDRRSSLDRILMGAAALGLLIAFISFGSRYAH